MKTNSFEDKLSRQRELRQRIKVTGRNGNEGSTLMKANLKLITEQVIEDNKEAIQLLANM